VHGQFDDATKVGEGSSPTRPGIGILNPLLSSIRAQGTTSVPRGPQRAVQILGSRRSRHVSGVPQQIRSMER
jgi:hypothetical protein